jgi:molybdopterin-guanine dinucleotide biosynthesis protein A
MNINSNEISCIVLAGGKGKRFNNQDKGLVELNNKPLIEHVLNAVQSQVDDIVISANRNIDTYKKYSPSVISDIDKNFCGPLSGISSAMPLCKHEWVLIVPCDMPLLPENLVEQMQRTIDNQPLCIVESNGQLQLVLLLHTSLLQNIKQSLTQKHYKLLSWVKSQQHVVVNFHDDAIFNNINSMEQLSQIS